MKASLITSRILALTRSQPLLAASDSFHTTSFCLKLTAKSIRLGSAVEPHSLWRTTAETKRAEEWGSRSILTMVSCVPPQVLVRNVDKLAPLLRPTSRSLRLCHPLPPSAQVYASRFLLIHICQKIPHSNSHSYAAVMLLKFPNRLGLLQQQGPRSPDSHGPCCSWSPSLGPSLFMNSSSCYLDW